jgi:hypothetical protein
MYIRTMRVLVLFTMLMASCANRPPFDEAVEVEKGGSIATASFQTLMARVGAAMQEGGAAYAVSYCNLQALPLVDSLSRVHGVRIKRTSDRLRSPHDHPDADEQRALAHFLDRLSTGNDPAPPIAWLIGDSVAYYQPIFIASPTCLKCHGTPGRELEPLAHEEILKRYPRDLAIGYAEGEFRGLWSIRWAR